eukprot:93044_1
MLVINILCILFALYNAETQTACQFTTQRNQQEYHPFTSITTLPFDGEPPDDYIWGHKGLIGGVNQNDTIYLIGGTYKVTLHDQVMGEGPCRWWYRMNAYDSWIAYDNTVRLENITTIQSLWEGSPWVPPYYIMPTITPPSDAFPWPRYIAGEQGGFICQNNQCGTYLNNRIYVINPMMASEDLQQWDNWAKMIIFDMDDSDPHYLSESEFTSDPPFNYNGTLKLAGLGCTAHNGTHIFHFNWAVSHVLYDSYQTTYAYHPDTDQWTLLSGNPGNKFSPACTGDLSGRYVYLFAGTATHLTLLSGDASNPTDKYDTWTDTWTRLPSTADYPEIYGRENAMSMLDRSARSIIITGGSIWTGACTYRCWVQVNTVEIFRVDTEDWIIAEDETEAITIPGSSAFVAMVKVDNFMPDIHANINDDISADMMFLFGGGTHNGYSNDIRFMSTLTEREYYPDDMVFIEGQRPTDEEIETTAFDPWQRFEIAFRIVMTEGIVYDIDDSWNISFSIDGKSIDEINAEYDTQIMTRPPCQCWGRQCQSMPQNVKSVTVIELMIPSRRTLHNGYCVDRELPWIFWYDKASNITVIATNGQYTHYKEFVFEFMKIELISVEEAIQSEVIRGCKVTNQSHGVLSNFAIQCDGYTCAKCPMFPRIGRVDAQGRTKSLALRNEIEYNLLMNDVLLGAYVRQDYVEHQLIGTETLNTESLIAVVRVRTAVGTWYQECFYNFTDEFTEDWDTLTSILNHTTNQELWDEVIDQLNSNHNENVIAAYSILTEMIAHDDVPEGENSAQEITNALQNIMDTHTDNHTVEELTTNLALVDLLTSDTALVEPRIVLEISSEFIPSVLEMALSLLTDSETEYEPGVLADTVQNLGEIANSAASNLLNVSNLTESTRQHLVEDVQQIMNTEMTGSWQGEVILHIRDGSITKGYIINKDEPCELDDVLVEIPPHNAATKSDTLKCIITTTVEDEITINLFNGSGTRVFRTNDTCFPYFISMNIPSKYSGAFERALTGDWYHETIQFPQCTFWNVSEEEWSGEGCFVYEMNSDSVTCACTHLTTFKVSVEEFDPKAELLSNSDVREFNWMNMQKHPTTWVTMVLMVIVLSVACICVPNNHADRPIIAYEDIIYKEFRDQHLDSYQQWHEIQGMDRFYSKTYYCLLSMSLFKTYLRNDHTVLSVFERTDGTNLSSKQRIGLFLLYMYMIMMADAIFYGRQQERRPMGELTASILISLLATLPVYIIRKLFEWSKPMVVKSTRTMPFVTQEDTSSYIASITELKGTRHPGVKLVRKCMNCVNTNVSGKLAVAQEIRLILFNYNFPLPQLCKMMAWAILIATSLMCIIIAVTYGIRFDIRSDQYESAFLEMDNNKCWNMSLQLLARSEVLSSQILEIQAEQARDKSYSDDFDLLIYDSTKWILNVLISFLTSVFIWQPASIYFVTCCKIWAFHNGFIMEFSLANMMMFLANYCCCGWVCGGFSRRRDVKVSNTDSSSGFNHLLCDDHQLDMIGFLCHDDFFIHLPENSVVDLDPIHQ